MQHLFEQKLQELTDERLIVLSKLRADYNQQVITLARNELERRYPRIQLPDPPYPPAQIFHEHADNLSELDTFNWAACLLAPWWLLAHRLDAWLLGLIVPWLSLMILPAPYNSIVTLLATIVYLLFIEFRGNKLAYAKSPLGIHGFVQTQRIWKKALLLIFFIALSELVLSAIIDSRQSL